MSVYFSAPAASTAGFAFGGLGGVTATPAAATTTTSASLFGGGSLFAQKPASGFSFGTPAPGRLMCFDTRVLIH